MFFLHRQNNLDKQIYEGVEIDIRSVYGVLYLNHDRLNEHFEHLKFRSYLENLKEQKPQKIIANVKESGLEEQILREFKEYGLDRLGFELFFLDSQIPDINRLSSNTDYHGKFIIRISDIESINFKLISKSKAKYIWLDFSEMNNFAENRLDFDNIVEAVLYYIEKFPNFPCPIFVSPELYSIDNFKHIDDIIKIIKDKHINNFKICTKDPMRWITKGINVRPI